MTQNVSATTLDQVRMTPLSVVPVDPMAMMKTAPDMPVQPDPDAI